MDLISRDSRDALVRALKHPQNAVRRMAIEAMVQLKLVDAKVPIRLLLNDPSAVVRREAVKALGLLGDLEAAPLLAQRLADSDSLVAQKAAQGLQAFGEGVVKSLLGSLKEADRDYGKIRTELQTILQALSRD